VLFPIYLDKQKWVSSTPPRPRTDRSFCPEPPSDVTSSPSFPNEETKNSCRTSCQQDF